MLIQFVRSKVGPICLFLIVGCSPQISRNAEVPGQLVNEDFTLQVEPIVALDNGPVIIKVTYTYRGHEELLVERSPKDEEAIVIAPSDWRRRDNVASTTGRSVKTLKPGLQEVQFFRLHHDYDGIVVGNHNVSFKWEVRTSNGTLIASPKEAISVHVQITDDESVNKLRELLLNGDESKSWINSVVRSIEPSHDRRLLKFYFELLDNPSMASHRISIIRRLFSSGDGDKPSLRETEQLKLTHAVVEYLCRQRPKCAGPVLERAYETLDRTMLANAIAPHVKEFNPLTAAVCFARFRSLFDEEKESAILRELSQLSSTQSDRDIERWIQQLDAESYRTRELASAALRGVGPFASSRLKERLTRPVTAECAARVRQLIELIAQEDSRESQPYEDGVLETLKGLHTPFALAAIAAIARNEGDCWIVREARAIIRMDKGPQLD